MGVERLAEQLYLIATEELTAAALLLAFLSLLARLRGLQKGILVSRPGALYGLIGSIGGLLAFYALYAAFGQPASIVARGGVVRLLIIILCLSLLYWNWDYVHLALRRWKDDAVI